MIDGRPPGPPKPHISVCLCTYKRPEMLDRLLGLLEELATDGSFAYSVIVVDNDRLASARAICERHASHSRVMIRYEQEPEQNIALARNKLLEAATGDFIAMLDDDESPQNDWLAALFRECERTQADGVLGPVVPRYEVPPPSWVIQGKIFDRPNPATGTVLQWHQTRTGNVLFRTEALDKGKNRFDPKLGRGGEDMDFFKRMIEQGKTFVWCREAPVFETIAPIRWKVPFLLRKAFHKGQITARHPSYKKSLAGRSLFAVLAFTIGFPFLRLLGKPVYMKYFIGYAYHAGRLLTLLRIVGINDKYIVD